MTHERKQVPSFESIAKANATDGNFHGLDLVLDKAKEIADERMRLQAENAELIEKARQDPLTKLLNKDGLAHHIELWSANEERAPRFAVVYIDLDSFKRVNDLYGHTKGDEALQLISGILSDAFRRDEEAVARVGGDEFALFVPLTQETGQEGHRKELYEAELQDYISRILKDRLNKSITEDMSLEYMSEIGFSVGVELFESSDAAKPIKDLYKRADERMYRHKRKNKRTTSSS